MIGVYRLENKYFTNITTNNFIACNIRNKRAPHTCTLAHLHQRNMTCRYAPDNPTTCQCLPDCTAIRLQAKHSSSATTVPTSDNLLTLAHITCAKDAKASSEFMLHQLTNWMNKRAASGRTDIRTYRRKNRKTSQRLTSDLTSKQTLRLELWQ